MGNKESSQKDNKHVLSSKILDMAMEATDLTEQEILDSHAEFIVKRADFFLDKKDFWISSNTTVKLIHFIL
jgi:hypothetical protein